MDFDPVAYFHIAYRLHRIMNPLHQHRLLQAVSSCGLNEESRILDIGSGKGYASLALMQSSGCHATLVDSSPVWIAAAEAIFDEAGMQARAKLHQMDATQFLHEPATFDLIICLGTTPVYGSFAAAAESLIPALRPGGYLLVGEPTIDGTPPKRYSNFLREWGWVVPGIRTVLKDCALLDLELVTSLRSTREEWDEYMNLQWLAIAEHARGNPDDEQATDFLEWMRDEQEVYMRFQRHYMDWNLLLLQTPQHR